MPEYPDLDFGETLREIRKGQRVFSNRYALREQLGGGGIGAASLIRVVRLLIRQVLAQALTACFAAAAGKAVPGTAARPIAASARPSPATSTGAFVSYWFPDLNQPAGASLPVSPAMGNFHSSDPKTLKPDPFSAFITVLSHRSSPGFTVPLSDENQRAQFGMLVGLGCLDGFWANRLSFGQTGQSALVGKF